MLSVISIDETEKWDKIVKSFKDYDVYYLSGYSKAFQLHGDGEPLLFSYEGKNIKGINVVMKRDISKSEPFNGKIEENTWFDFSTSYGYGGWLIEGEETEGLFKEYENWCCKKNIVSEFVRFHPVLRNNIPSTSSYEVIPLGETVAMDLTSPEVIWANITSKNRNVIRKAIKSGVKIYNGRWPEVYETFREIYNCTMDKDHAKEYYYFGPAFYESVLEDLPQSAQVFYAELDGKVIASSIMLAANGKLNYHLSGSLREYANLAATNLLLYEAALWGSANGCKTFHLGGGVGSGEDSLFKFKRAFYRGYLNRFHIGRKIMNQEEYEKLVSLRTDISAESGYFPRYRLAEDKERLNR